MLVWNSVIINIYNKTTVDARNSAQNMHKSLSVSYDILTVKTFSVPYYLLVLVAGMVHSDSGWTRGVQVKLWDPLRTRAIPERRRGVFTTRRYTNPRLPYLTSYGQSVVVGNSCCIIILCVCQQGLGADMEKCHMGVRADMEKCHMGWSSSRGLLLMMLDTLRPLNCASRSVVTRSLELKGASIIVFVWKCK